MSSNRPYEKIATKSHTCRMSDWNGCPQTIKRGDPVVSFEGGAAHYSCVDISFYAEAHGTHDHSGPEGGV